MSPPWSNSLDITRLADTQADIDFHVPVEELAVLREQFPHICGSVAGHARFERFSGLPVVEITLHGTVELTCQRCLEPLQLPIERQVRVGLIETEAQQSQVPEELEPMLAPGGRISVGALVAEELLLTLPIVPQHEADECPELPPAPRIEDPSAEPTQRPFAGLGELLNRK